MYLIKIKDGEDTGGGGMYEYLWLQLDIYALSDTNTFTLSEVDVCLSGVSQLSQKQKGSVLYSKGLHHPGFSTSQGAIAVAVTLRPGGSSLKHGF